MRLNMDIKTPEERSMNMAAIRSKDTKPELMLRKALHKEGLRYRVNNSLPGRPDIVFCSKKVAVFVDGCFWHGCPKCYKEPATNQEFWKGKKEKNLSRDSEVNTKLKEKGWRVERFWEHEIYQDIDLIVAKIINMVRGLKNIS
jgi:DNA mismatch endonuclease, patch repair protein